METFIDRATSATIGRNLVYLSLQAVFVLSGIEQVEKYGYELSDFVGYFLK